MSTTANIPGVYSELGRGSCLGEGRASLGLNGILVMGQWWGKLDENDTSYRPIVNNNLNFRNFKEMIA